MIFKGHDIRISKNKIIYELDNERYNMKNHDDYIKYVTNPIRQELNLESLDLTPFIDESLTEEQIETEKPLTEEPVKINIDYIERPMPAHNKVLRDRKFKIGDNFGSMMYKSNKNEGDVKGMKFTNYIYENKMDEVMSFINNECGKKMSRRTFDKHLKYIMSTGYGLVELKNTPNGLAYQLSATTDGGYYVTIPNCQLRDLLLCSNEDMLRLFIIFKDYSKGDTDKFITMDRGFLARSIGLSDKNTKSLLRISTMVNGLARLGYIEIKTVNERYADKEGNLSYRTVNSYRVRTVEEWQEIKKKASGKK